MKISEALHILNITNYTIDNIHNISFDELRKYYHIQCIIYHPDKNNVDEDATLLFQNINCAYTILKELITNYNNDFKDNNNDDNNNDDNNNDDNNNDDLLVLFLNFIINFYSNSENTDNFKKDIINFKIKAHIHIKALLTNLFEYFSIVILEDLYHYLLNYKKNHNATNDNTYDNINIYDSIIEIIKTTLEEKLQDHSIYILSPNLLNLLNSDIYKLEIHNAIVYIPLWHNELNYENNIIKIEPLLKDHITIDTNNNIHYNYYNNYNTITDLLRNNIVNIVINIEEHYPIEINISDLKFSPYQVYCAKNKGIPKINTSNILDNTQKADIYFHIHLL